jgi:hypothetical protein
MRALATLLFAVLLAACQRQTPEHDAHMAILACAPRAPAEECERDGLAGSLRLRDTREGVVRPLRRGALRMLAVKHTGPDADRSGVESSRSLIFDAREVDLEKLVELLDRRLGPHERGACWVWSRWDGTSVTLCGSYPGTPHEMRVERRQSGVFVPSTLDEDDRIWGEIGAFLIASR